MKFKVTGQNKDTGARMVLEFEAESKGAAERKALTPGMSVNRVEDISDGHVGKAHDPHPKAGHRSGGNKTMLILVVVVIAAVAYYFWPKISSMIHH